MAAPGVAQIPADPGAALREMAAPGVRVVPWGCTRALGCDTLSRGRKMGLLGGTLKVGACRAGRDCLVGVLAGDEPRPESPPLLLYLQHTSKFYTQSRGYPALQRLSIIRH
jgi:hypothetical protein